MDKQWIEKKKSEIKSTVHKQLISIDSTETTDDYVVVSGYVNRFIDKEGNVVRDRDGEAVTPYGMDVSEYEKNPVILFQHNRDEPIGKAVKVEKREDGIYMVMHIFKALNSKVYDAVRLGALSAFSIGFRVKDLYYDEEKDIFYLVSTVLLENSIVSVPANQESIIESVESPQGVKCLGVSGKALGNSKYSDDALDSLHSVVKELIDKVDTILHKDPAPEQEPEKLEDNEGETPEPENLEDGGQVPENLKEGEGETAEGEQEPEKLEAPEKPDIRVEDVVTIIQETKVSEENFDSLLAVAERLNQELNSFLEQNLTQE